MGWFGKKQNDDSAKQATIDGLRSLIRLGTSDISAVGIPIGTDMDPGTDVTITPLLVRDHFIATVKRGNADVATLAFTYSEGTPDKTAVAWIIAALANGLEIGSSHSAQFRNLDLKVREDRDGLRTIEVKSSGNPRLTMRWPDPAWRGPSGPGLRPVQFISSLPGPPELSEETKRQEDDLIARLHAMQERQLQKKDRGV